MCRGDKIGGIFHTKPLHFDSCCFFKRKLDKPKTSWYHCGDRFCINGNLCWQQSPAGCAISDWITENMRACPAWNSCKIPHLDPTWGQRVANQPLVTTANADPCEAAARRYTGSDIFIGPAAASRSLRGARVLSILRQLSSLVWSPLKWHLGTFLIFLFKLWGQSQNIKSLHKELLSSFWISCQNTLTCLRNLKSLKLQGKQDDQQIWRIIWLASVNLGSSPSQTRNGIYTIFFSWRT